MCVFLHSFIIPPIYNFIYDSIDYIVFAILIFAAFIILLSGDNPQIKKLQGNITDTFAFLAYPKRLIRKTTGLIQENKKLRRKNLRLQQRNSRLIEAYKENQRYEKLLGFSDSVDHKVLPSRIINYNSIYFTFYFILIYLDTLDKKLSNSSVAA